MKLLDPTISASSRPDSIRAPTLESLDGKTIGILSNAKPNADLLLQETAGLLADKYGGRVNRLVYKSNPSAPADPATLSAIAAECDYLLTAIGD